MLKDNGDRKLKQVGSEWEGGTEGVVNDGWAHQKDRGR